MRCRVVSTRSGEALVSAVIARHALPNVTYRHLLDEVNFDLDEDAESKLQKCGAVSERQYAYTVPPLNGKFWFQFEVNFDERPCEARILDCRFIPFNPLVSSHRTPRSGD